MKKIELHLNFNEIKKRIEIDKAPYGVGEWADLIGISIASVSNIHGKKGKVKPSIEYIVAVAKVTGKPIEWYLYGTQPENQAKAMTEEEFMAQWPEEIKNACRQLKEILLSDHPVIKPALLSNLAAFQHSVQEEKVHRDRDNKRDEEIRKLRKRIRFLEERDQADPASGTGAAASSSTGKKET